MGSPLVRAAFALIVCATIAAFFVTQQLKGEFPLVLRFAASPNVISPNGDGFREDTLVGFDLSRPAKVSFEVVDSEGSEMRRLVDDRQLVGDTKHRYFWNGHDDEGRRVPDGIYRLRLINRDEGRVINSIKKIRVDTRRPRVRLTSARPGVISPGDPGQRPRVRIRYRGPKNGAPEFRIFRTDDGPPRVVARFRGDKTRSAVWHGTLRGRPAPDGDYAFTVTVRDRAGNRAVAPTDIPTRRLARAGTGVAVRHLTLRGPVTVMHAGGLARLDVGPYARPFRFTLSGLGSRPVLARGRRVGGRFRVRVPAGSRTGVYLLRVRAGARRAAWPVAVAGRPTRRGRRPLAVLPAITWQGLNRWDDDLDGFADTLDSARSLALDRPFVRTPPRFDTETASLLRFLDRARLPYDLTTDAALARGGLPDAPGVAVAGSARWLTPALLQRLRRYVEDGGRLASFGVGAFRRSIRLRGGVLREPTAARREDAFGERTRLMRTASAPLAVGEDRLALFEDPLVAEFGSFERSIALLRGARRLTEAGPAADEPAFVAYRLGRGLVVRVGTPRWSGALFDAGVAAATRRIWRLLQRG